MQRDIAGLKNQQFDLIIVGAGVHGACVARDASLRGLKVALIDQDDICGATSHNSLKTIHGGIRYLQHLNFKRSLESINEQKYWLETAPHLVKPLPFLMPTYGYGMRGPIAMYLGIRLFELLGIGRNRRLAKESKLPRGKILSKQACLDVAPGINTARLTGGALWYDAQVEFADRAVLQIANHAAALGASVANYVSAGELLFEQETNTVLGIQVQDKLSGDTFQIKGNIVINAAGPWAAKIINKIPHQSLPKFNLPLTKSMNIVTRLPASDYAVGVQSKRESDSVVGSTKRLYFIVPWQGRCVIGTTHFAHRSDVDDDQKRSPKQDIADFVQEINYAYPSLNLSIDDVLYCYQGLTPADDGSSNKNATRLHESKVIDHAQQHNISGLISIISIKWTTARLVAERSVDLAANKLGNKQTCQTRHRPIPDTPELTYDFAKLDDVALIKACQEHMEYSMTMRLADMLLRRTNDLVTGRLSTGQIKLISETMATYYGWTEQQKAAELDNLHQVWLPFEVGF